MLSIYKLSRMLSMVTVRSSFLIKSPGGREGAGVAGFEGASVRFPWHPHKKELNPCSHAFS